MKPIEVAFIGGGLNSAVGYVHFSACNIDNRFKVVAGAFSRHENTNKETADYWGIEPNRAYSSWQGLIENEKGKVDAFVVLTPTPDHLPILLELIEKRLPVICEKAMVSSVSDIEMLKKVYDPELNFLAVTFNYSGYAMVRELRSRVQQGALGKIQKIHIEMPQEGFRRPPDIAGKASKPQAWRLKDGDVPTICLDLGVHLHHLSSFLLGEEPVALIANMSNHSEYDGLIDDVQLMLEYPNGVTGSMWMSKTAIGNRNGLRIRLFGDLGSATWFQLNPDELSLAYNDGRIEILDRAGQCDYAGAFRYNRMKPGHPTGFVEAFANLYSDIADEFQSFKNGSRHSSEYVFGLEHAADGIALFDKAKKSHLQKCWVNI